MGFSPKVVQILQKLIDQQLQDFSSNIEERNILIKCRQELKNNMIKCEINPVPLLYSRRKD